VDKIYSPLRAKTLEDLFFLEEEKRLTENLRKMKALKETKEALSQVSGIRDETILQKLVDLDVKPQTVASLALIPLIEVAWADGSVDEKEKNVVLKGAAKYVFGESQIDHDLLETWLDRKPGPELLAAWAQYVSELCGRLSAGEREKMRSEILDDIVKVARSSGGFLGIGAISKKEKEMILGLKRAFDVKG